MALTMIRLGEKCKIQSFRGSEKMKRHLQDLGFVNGETVELVGENPSGLILSVKGVRLALNRGLASMITVEQLM